jgi:predicted HicB family RNase H-like nuclease
MEKNLKITEKLHTKIKIYCAENKLKINDWVDKELSKIINDKNVNK